MRRGGQHGVPGGFAFGRRVERIFATKAALTSQVPDTSDREKSFWPSRFIGY
jgi:hypothetical protein